MRAVLRFPGPGPDSNLPWTASLPCVRAIAEVCRGSLQKKLLYIGLHPVLAPCDVVLWHRRGTRAPVIDLSVLSVASLMLLHAVLQVVRRA